MSEETAVSQPLLPWSAQLALGQSVMDDTHREFVDLLNRVAAAPEQDLLASLDAFITHTEQHFGEEERWMQEFAFPPLHCHQGEHANVLEVIREVRRRVADGQVQLGATLTQALAEWFPQHAGSMDAVLAMYMKEIGYTPGGDNTAAIATAAAATVAQAAPGCAPGADACGHTAPAESR
jgi:hemerythrin-like metal-binding protein